MSESGSQQYEAFVECFARHEADLRTFVRSLLPTWHDADEVLQQVALVAWRKFDQFDQSTNFIKWACVIARFEALAYRRKMARDRLVFSEELMAQLAEEAAEETEDRRAENAALEACLKKLPADLREFVTLAYTPGTSTKELAERAGVKPGSFYMRLNRIRKTLLDCVENSIAQGGLT
ncbi:MAG: sigma-70 family RNA polymerase sigma factor [Verrucomicrobiae bacterium]|jgi:RNA polymerase sigma-70 factor (ECF subfamily)|nr:sigma-70 family RNA polymerase sigma factor [Verrucomicrobiae bacterium]